MTLQGNTGVAPILLKPGVFSAYGHGWDQMWKQFLELFLVLVISSLITGLGGWMVSWIPFISPLFSIFVSNPLNYGVSFAYLRAARTEKMEIQDMFAGFLNYWNAVLAGLLVTVIVVVGLIFIIVPGIYFACKLAFTPYLVVDRKMQAIDAIKASWNMTNGYGWKVFLIGLLAIPVVIAGLICLGVGVIISMMWISMAFASLYHAVSLEKGVPVTPVAPVPPQPAT